MGLLKVISLPNMHAPGKENYPLVESTSANRFSFSKNKRLIINTSFGFRIITFNSIVSLMSDSNYTIINLQDGQSILASKTMKYYEEKLDYNFLKVHKSHIINLNFLITYNKSESEIQMDNGDSIPVARRKKSMVESYFLNN